MKDQAEIGLYKRFRLMIVATLGGILSGVFKCRFNPFVVARNFLFRRYDDRTEALHI